MKRFFVLPLLLVFLCGCSKSTQVKPVLDNISFEAEISYGDDNFVCDTILQENNLSLSVIEPDEINGLSLTLDENSVKAEFNGLSFEPDINSIPQGAVAKVFFAILNDAEGKLLDYNEQNCVLNGIAAENKYQFIFSPKGLPISLTVDELDLKINFKNVVIK